MTSSTTGFSAFKSCVNFVKLEPIAVEKTKKMEMRNVCNLSKVLHTKHKVSLYQDQNYRKSKFGVDRSFALKQGRVGKVFLVADQIANAQLLAGRNFH